MGKYRVGNANHVVGDALEAEVGNRGVALPLIFRCKVGERGQTASPGVFLALPWGGASPSPCHSWGTDFPR